MRYFNQLILKILCACLFLGQTFAATPIELDEMATFPATMTPQVAKNPPGDNGATEACLSDITDPIADYI
jgi:hypothetical protein